METHLVLVLIPVCVGGSNAYAEVKHVKHVMLQSWYRNFMWQNFQEINMRLNFG